MGLDREDKTLIIGSIVELVKGLLARRKAKKVNKLLAMMTPETYEAFQRARTEVDAAARGNRTAAITHAEAVALDWVLDQLGAGLKGLRQLFR